MHEDVVFSKHEPIPLCRHLLNVRDVWFKDFCSTQSYLKQLSANLLKGRFINICIQLPVVQ